jgi:hypothetical protein
VECGGGDGERGDEGPNEGLVASAAQRTHRSKSFMRTEVGYSKMEQRLSCLKKVEVKMVIALSLRWCCLKNVEVKVVVAVF